MFIWKCRNKKAFTIIELIVVIAMLGILVLLGMPKFLGYVSKAQLVNIQNDVKAAENVIGAKLVNEDKLPEEWLSITNEDLDELKLDNKLYDVKGLLAHDYEIQDEGYVNMPSELFNTNLKGNFYANQGGKVYYEATKSGVVNNPGVSKPIDKNDLIKDKESAEKLNPNDYQDFTKVNDAITELDRVINDDNVIQKEIDNAKKGLENAIKDLVPKSENINVITSGQLELTPTYNSVTVEATVAGVEVQIGIDGSWQASPHTFEGLEELHEYTIYARYKETETHIAGKVSDGLKFSTIKAALPAPGPNAIVGGNVDAGYFGITSASELITGNDLATAIGLTAGTSQFSEEGWLKFSYKGNIQYVAKKPLRYGISWDQINEKGVVFGTKTVVINGFTYKVRLMKTVPEGYNTEANYTTDMHGSEWNKLMLPIHEKASGTKGDWYSTASVGSIDTADWNIGFTDEDLHTNLTAGNGTYSWMQETNTRNFRLVRGYRGVSYSNAQPAADMDMYLGWRPVLELVPTP